MVAASRLHAEERTAPKHKMQVVPETRRLFVSANGVFWDEGSLEMIDLDTLRSLELFLREADGTLGVDLLAFVLVTPDPIPTTGRPTDLVLIAGGSGDQAVPTMSGSGLVVMALLLCAGAKTLLARRIQDRSHAR